MGPSKKRAARWSPRAGDVGGEHPSEKAEEGMSGARALPSQCLRPSSESSLPLGWDLRSPCAPELIPSPASAAHTPPPIQHGVLLSSGLTVGAALCGGAPLQLPLPKDAMA